MTGTGNVTFTGPGTATVVTFSGPNGYSGGTALGNFTMQVANNTALGTGPLDLSTNGALQSSGTFTLANNYSLSGGYSFTGTQNLTLNGTGNLNAQTLTVSNTAGTITLGGIVSGAPGNITQNGVGGTLALTGANTYSGTTTLTNGTLSIGNNTALGNSALSLNGGSLRSSGAFTIANNVTVNNSASSIGGTNNLTLNGTVNLNGNSLTVNNTAGAIRFNNVISGAGAGSTLIQNGAGGTLQLGGANTYAGGTNIIAGTLQLVVADNRLPTTGALTMSGGIFDLNGFNQTIGDLSGVGSITMVSAVASKTLTFGTSTSSTTFAGTISNGTGTVAIVKQGSGTVILTGANSYTGGTTISAGTLQGTTISLQGNILDNAALVFDQTFNGSYSSVISGSGTVTKQNTGTVTFTNANTYSGGTFINQGTLAISSDANLGNASGGITFGNPGGGILSLTASVNSARTVNLINSGEIDTAAGTTSTFSGVITGAGSLTKGGTGTLILTNTNDYSGGTIVSAGTLQGTTSSLQGNIVNNASVIFNQNTTGMYAGIMSGTGNLSVLGGGTVILGGPNSYSGGTTVSGAGTVLQGTTNSLQGNIVDNASVVFEQSTSGTYLGTISGSGTVSIQGGGVIAFPNPQTYTGLTTIAPNTTLNMDAVSLINSLNGPVSNSGNLSIGDTSLSLNGSYTQNATGALSIMIDAMNTPYGHVTVQNNNATISGFVNVAFSELNGACIATTQTFDILTTTGAGLLTLNMPTLVVTPGCSLVNFTLTNVDNHILRLTAMRTPMNMLPDLGNSQLAIVLEEIRAQVFPANGSAPIFPSDELATFQNFFVTLDGLFLATSDVTKALSEVSAVLRQLQPDINVISASTELLNTSLTPIKGRLMALHEDRERFNSGYVAGDIEGRISWGPLFYSGSGKQGIRDIQTPYHYQTGGLGFFSDVALNECSRVGASFTYANSAITSDVTFPFPNTNRNNIRTGQAAAYLSFDYQKAFVDCIAAYGLNGYYFKHNVSFSNGLSNAGNSFNNQVNAKYHGKQSTAEIRAGLVLPIGKMYLTPLASLQYVHLSIGSYTERGAMGQRVQAQKQFGCFWGTGLWLSAPCLREGLLPEVHVQFFHNTKASPVLTSSQFNAAGSPFIIPGVKPVKNRFNVGTSLTMEVIDCLLFSLSYDLDTQSQFRAQSGAARLRWIF